MLNKINSFLIILILLYITFEYCQLYEGQADTPDTPAGRQGNDQGSDDASAKKPKCPKDPAMDFSVPTKTIPCQYEGKSCLDLMGNIKEDEWVQFGDSSDNHVGTPKYNCSQCVQGSNVDSSFRYYLANVRTDLDWNVSHSKFADDLCDAMAADCDDAFFYAINKQDWWHDDCSGITVETHGYTNFVSGEIPSCLGMDTRSTKRSNTWVVETCDDAIFSDERFMVFDFTE